MLNVSHLNFKAPAWSLEAPSALHLIVSEFLPLLWGILLLFFVLEIVITTAAKISSSRVILASALKVWDFLIRQHSCAGLQWAHLSKLHPWILRAAQAPRQLFKKTIQSVRSAIFESLVIFNKKRKRGSGKMFTGWQKVFSVEGVWWEFPLLFIHYLKLYREAWQQNRAVWIRQNLQLFGSRPLFLPVSPVPTGLVYPQGAHSKLD